MYSTCFHCQRDLGRNEVVEHLPIGRRLAYDETAGRIWVICPHCARWNLVPFESRWDAIEEAERAFRDTPLRASTDNVALARTSEGAELVRIGKPVQQEIASWRYGRHFARRRWNYLTTTAPMAGAFFVASQLITHSDLLLRIAGVQIPFLWQLGGLTAVGAAVGEARARWFTFRTQALLALRDEVTPLSRGLVDRIRASPGADGTLQLWVPVVEKRYEDHAPFSEMLRVFGSIIPSLLHWDASRNYKPMQPTHFASVTGSDALAVLRTLLPVMNEAGASSRSLDESLAYLQRHRHDPAHIAFGGKRSWEVATSTPLKEFHHERRLALEMAVHAESERRWLEGEMHDLLEEWRRANEIASIADALLRDPAIEAKLGTLRTNPPVSDA